MMFFSKTPENIERFRELYNDEILHSIYKYLTSISVAESDLSAYIEHFKACEKLGLSYTFYYIDSDENNRRIIGFSDFAIKDMPESHVIDLTYFDADDINKYFSKIFREDGYFIISDNSIRKDSYEELTYKEIINRVRKDKDNSHLYILK